MKRLVNEGVGYDFIVVIANYHLAQPVLCLGIHFDYRTLPLPRIEHSIAHLESLDVSKPWACCDVKFAANSEIDPKAKCGGKREFPGHCGKFRHHRLEPEQGFVGILCVKFPLYQSSHGSAFLELPLQRTK
jgi:hypothetical protein